MRTVYNLDRLQPDRLPARVDHVSQSVSQSERCLRYVL